MSILLTVVILKEECLIPSEIKKWKLYFGFLTFSPPISFFNVKVTQSCPTLCDPMDFSLLGFSVHGIIQARILEWVAISFSGGPSQPRDQTQVSCIAGDLFTI